MALAEKSLQADLDRHVPISETEAVEILLQITDGMSELDGLVHRDLKPANLLFHQGAWKIADFEIARFVEESTSLHTLKDCLSPQYAAPEQWRFERAETATDLYALGCIGFCLLTGRAPFYGPCSDDFREQHLKQEPPSLPSNIHPRLRTLIGMLLRKAPEARPSLTRVKEILGGCKAEAQRVNSPIAEVAARLEVARAQAEALSQQRKAVEDTREALAAGGRTLIGGMIERLRARILEEAATCSRDALILVKLGQAQFPLPISRNFTFLATVPIGSFAHSGIDVVLATTLEIYQIDPNYTWSSTLLYCRLPNTADYRWYEVSFMTVFHSVPMAPYSLLNRVSSVDHGYSDIDLALSTTLHRHQAAFGPTPIDDENEDEFIERWMALFALAAEGRMRYPSRLPLTPTFWRQFATYGM